MTRLIYLLTVSWSLTLISCDRDDGPEGSTLRLTVAGQKFTLENASIYLYYEQDFDVTDDNLDANTHTYSEFYITDQNWLENSTRISYQIFLSLEYPIIQGKDGDYSMTANTIWNRNTRFAYFDAHYNNTTPEGWGNKYNFVGWRQSDSESTLRIRINEDNPNLMWVRLKGKMEKWNFNGNTEPNWSLKEENIDVNVAFDYEGEIIDVRGLLGRIDSRSPRRR